VKTLKTVLVLFMLAALGGCAVYPAAPYYGPPHAAYYQQAPVYYGPAVGFYGGYRR
jgi:hypothetical protein